MKIGRKGRLALSILLTLVALYLTAVSVLFWYLYGLNDNGDPPPPLYQGIFWFSLLLILLLLSATFAVKNFKLFKAQGKLKAKKP